MTKLMLSLGDQTFRTLALEAKSQDVTVQQLVRALIVPEWVRQNVSDESPSSALHRILPPVPYQGRRHPMLQSPIGRLRA